MYYYNNLRLYSIVKIIGLIFLALFGYSDITKYPSFHPNFAGSLFYSYPNAHKCLSVSYFKSVSEQVAKLLLWGILFISLLVSLKLILRQNG